MATTTRILCFVLVMVLMGCCCSAKIYKVGDSEGWTAKGGTYYAWASRKEFQVGDSLIFEYDGNVNDVTRVSSALEYQFCNSASPQAVYETGHDVVTLAEPGYHFFISSNHSQCVAGQKLVVFVVQYHQIPPPPPRKILPFAKDFKVGDSQEWRVPDESDFYSKWSEEKQFHVGDNLLFYYNYEVDDILEVSGDLEFKSCDTSSPVAVHNSGQDLVRLTKPGIHYFITSKTPHCEDGLKLRVVVRPLTRVSGNGQLSPLKAQIYKLEDLSTRLKDIGYELDTSYVLQDIDDEHKEAILAHHSERVAIDFGLIDTE
ncbi:hypothetical protein Bca4012_002827 [Brassica carinata]